MGRVLTTPDAATTQRPSRRSLRLLAPAVVLPLLGVGGLMWFLDDYGQREQAQPADVIVVLGAQVVPPGVAGLSLRARTLKAVELYRQGLAPKIICTGGVGSFPPAEGQVAANLAIRHGVPAHDVLYEDTSTSTLENAQNAARICRTHNWQRVIVVSDPFHLWRARRDFESLGLTAFPSPAPNRRPGSRLLNTAREAACVLRDLVWRP